MSREKTEQILKDMFKSYTSSYRAKDDQKLNIAVKKSEYEETLDEMWRIYAGGNPAQIVEYNKQLDSIKGCGCKVLRNSSGKHKIVIG